MRAAVVGLRIVLAGGIAVFGATAAPLAASAAYRPPHHHQRHHPGSRQHTVLVHLVRGGPAKTEHGRLRTISDRYDYLFPAHKGAVLTTRESGAAVRLVITYPNGNADGPGFPEKLRLPQTGRYKIEVSPDQMADGALGPFTLTLRLR